MNHEITVARDTNRRDGELYYRATCSCGKYRSGLSGYPGKAQRAGAAHAKAKNEAEAKWAQRDGSAT